MYSSEEGLLVGVVFVDGGVGQRMEGGDAVAVADGSDFFSQRSPVCPAQSRAEAAREKWVGLVWYWWGPLPLMRGKSRPQPLKGVLFDNDKGGEACGCWLTR